MLGALLLLVSVGHPRVVFCCQPTNDLYKLAVQLGNRPERVDSAGLKLLRLGSGDGLLVLDGNELTQELRQSFTTSGVRIYLEKVSTGREPVADTLWERAYVSSNAFGPDLAPGRILSIGRQKLPIYPAASPMISVGRIAGFDHLAFGLPPKSTPLLWQDGATVLSASAPLSRFAVARYAPAKAWRPVIQHILNWVGCSGEGMAKGWKPAVSPTYDAHQRLSASAQALAVKRAAEWFTRSHLLVDSSADQMYASADQWQDRVGPIPPGNGDGSLGMLEGYSSAVDPNGFQPVRWYRRADCNAEAAMTLALASSSHEREIGRRLGAYIVEKSSVQHLDSSKACFGLVGWNDQPGNRGNFYGDDNARYILGLIGAAGALKSNKWDDSILRCILANFRTTGTNGFRGDNLSESEIERLGWRHFFDAPTVNLAPHFEAYQWACWLLAYSHTGYRPLLERAEKAIGRLMSEGEGAWTWTNGIQQERVRMLLPLSWLVRVSNTAEHRTWLTDTLGRVLSHQDPCGAIREEIADLSHGIAGPPTSNEAFGTGETPLIQENGDPLADMLYTSNFALLGLHEAALATKDPKAIQAENSLAQFLVRIQIQSKTHPELSGAWFRAFDYGDWDYWASNADLGWGAWSVESGWSVAWIASVMALRERQTSLWDLHSGFHPSAGIVKQMMAERAP